MLRLCVAVSSRIPRMLKRARTILCCMSTDVHFSVLRCLALQDGDFNEKSKWKFMQKYWHKGAYYQTGADDQFQEANVDEIFKRDFSGATGEDKFDRTILPKVMQVKFTSHPHTHAVAYTLTSSQELQE